MFIIPINLLFFYLIFLQVYRDLSRSGRPGAHDATSQDPAAAEFIEVRPQGTGEKTGENWAALELRQLSMA